MASQKPALIIIPGLGDRTRAYSLFAFVWKRFGYRVHVFSFKWEDLSESFSSSFDRLLHYIDSLNCPVYAIGVSAGGSATVNALYARPQTVQRVATVAAVFRYDPRLNNDKLKDSVNNLAKNSTAQLNRRVLSVYGIYDQKVPTSSSKLAGGHLRQFLMFGHAPIILTGLTVYAGRIRRFLP